MISRNRAFFFVCVFLLSFCLSNPAAAANPYDETRLEVTELVTNLTRPMELDIASDGRIFYIELDGLLKMYDPKNGAVSTLAEIEVFNEQENGLIGLALDPNFDKNQHIFLQYSPPDFPGQHISRFKFSNGKLDKASEKVLLKFKEQRVECCHHSGSLQFGPNGCLFIGTGDNTHPGGDSHGYAPIDEREGKYPWDAQKSAANTHQRSGKILRIRPTADGGYEIPEGNLFPADGSAGCPEIYVMGCRNPWRLNVDQKTGYVYWGEVGPDARNNTDRGPRGYDEINQARRAGNFGWPYFIADNQAYADVDFASGEIGERYDPKRPINRSPNNTGSEILPPAQPAFIYYPYAYTEKFPELGEGGRTACAGPIYHFDPANRSKTKFPKHFDNTLFIYEWTRHWIKAVHLDEHSNIKSIEPFLADRKMQRPIDIEFGPDGAMYLIEYGETWGVNQDAKIVRIDYISGNRKPKAVASVKNNVGRDPLVVDFSSNGSIDKDADDTLSYQWVRVDPKEPTSETTKLSTVRTVLSTEPNPTVTFSDTGVFNVELVVRDGKGGSATASVPVIVGNAKPTIKLLEPTGGFFQPGSTIEYEIFVNDFEDGTNDIELADEQDLPEIDNDSPNRVSMNIRKVTGKFALDLDSEEAPPGLLLMKGSDCFNCHDIHNKRVGPPLMAISKKYRDDPHAIEKSVERVINGSTGVWGKVPMIAHKQHSNQEVHTMVGWIYGLRESGGLQVIRGFVGDITTNKEYSGGLLLEASYNDKGAGEIPAATETVTLRLRSRHIEAEHANKANGVALMQSPSANNKEFFGSINHHHYLRFDDIDTNSIGSVTCRVASNGAGGWIEFRQGKFDGPVLSRIRVDRKGEWEDWRDESAEFTASDGTHDLYIVFVNEEQKQALMNLDSIYFHPR